MKRTARDSPEGVAFADLHHVDPRGGANLQRPRVQGMGPRRHQRSVTTIDEEAADAVSRQQQARELTDQAGAHD
jgi:hypothetical protein